MNKFTSHFSIKLQKQQNIIELMNSYPEGMPPNCQNYDSQPSAYGYLAQQSSYNASYPASPYSYFSQNQQYIPNGQYTPNGQYGQNPQIIVIQQGSNNKCPFCGSTKGPIQRQKVGPTAIIWGAVLCCVTGCACCIPCLISDCMDKEYICIDCGKVIQEKQAEIC